MAAKTIMVQGTTSGAGKSILVTALCRIFKQDGYKVAPFKSQNMALNSFVTRRGEEMGRSQVVQAAAAGLEPSVDMNPILLKPEANSRCQVVLMGKPAMTLNAGEYGPRADQFLPAVTEALERLRAAYDIVVIEGAGSPAEINIRQHEIVNMRIAKLAGAPVLLVGDIDRGGVFASLVGTLALLDDSERSRIKGFIINKFRGEISLLQPGLDYLEKHTSRPVIGVIPYYRHIRIPEEDSIDLGQEVISGQADESLDIAIIHLPRLSNSTDFEPLQQEAGVRVRYVRTADELGEPDAIILPGTKSTVADLEFLRRSGIAEMIIRQANSGTPTIGICGGFQMMGTQIKDPGGVESAKGDIAGLGLLDVVTAFQSEKTTRQVKARVLGNEGLLAGLNGEEVTGYEIHMGQTPGSTNPLFRIIGNAEGQPEYIDGVAAPGGFIFGSYLHGLFDNTNFRHAFLSGLRRRKGLPITSESSAINQEEQFDALADVVRQNLNMALVNKICGL